MRTKAEARLAIERSKSVVEVISHLLSVRTREHIGSDSSVSKEMDTRLTSWMIPECRENSRVNRSSQLIEALVLFNNRLPLAAFGSAPYRLDETGIVKRVSETGCAVGAGA